MEGGWRRGLKSMEGGGYDCHYLNEKIYMNFRAKNQQFSCLFTNVCCLFTFISCLFAFAQLFDNIYQLFVYNFQLFVYFWSVVLILTTNLDLNI